MEPQGVHSKVLGRKIVTPSLPALAESFYERDPRRVARDLLGKVLVRRSGRMLRSARIVEVEAYLGTGDLAAHSASGLTARNHVIFGPPGRAYVYFIYGNHYCLNVSCEPEGEAGCVLIRALEPVTGIEQMARSRGIDFNTQLDQRQLTMGPGRLTEAFNITRINDNGRDLTTASSGLWIADDGWRPRRVAVTARVGITKAAERKLRYVVAGNRFVSAPRV
jgi:DNA-3-methyladenine glycosylase